MAEYKSQPRYGEAFDFQVMVGYTNYGRTELFKLLYLDVYVSVYPPHQLYVVR